MTNPFVFHTTYTAAEIEKRSHALVDLVRSTAMNTSISSNTQVNHIFPSTIDNPLPVIVFLNGSGSSGKSTFAKLVRRYASGRVPELSTVDPIRPVVSDLMRESTNNIDHLLKDSVDLEEDHVADRSQEWRIFMHDVKEAWTRFNNGPILYTFGTIIKMIQNKKKYRDISIIFVNVREKAAIEEMTKLATEMGLINFTVKVERTDPDTFQNEADANVDEIRYDIVIDNKSEIDDLQVKAFAFATFVEAANRVYGADCSTVQDDKIAYVMDREFQKAMEEEEEMLNRLAAMQDRDPEW